MAKPDFQILSDTELYSNSLTPFQAVALSSDEYSSNYYVWDLGDGNTEVGFSVEYVYDTVGDFDVTLTQYLSSGEPVESEPQKVTVRNLIPNLMEWDESSFSMASITASVKNETPFIANIYNSWQQYDSESFLHLYVENSKSIPFDISDKRIHLKPNWRFLDKGDLVIETIPLNQEKIYATKLNDKIYLSTTETVGSVFVGVSSQSEFYFIDDTPSGINPDENYLPSTIIVTQNLSGIYGDKKFTSEDYLQYPSLIKSVFVDNIIPDKLSITSNGVFDISDIKFVDTKIPYNIRLVDSSGNFIKTNPIESDGVSYYEMSIGLTQNIGTESIPSFIGNHLERFNPNFSNLGGFFESHFIPTNITTDTVTLTASTKIDYTINEVLTRYGIFSDENSNKIYRTSFIEGFNKDYIRKDSEIIGNEFDGFTSNKFGALIDTNYNSVFLDSDDSRIEIYDTSFELISSIDLSEYDNTELFDTHQYFETISDSDLDIIGEMPFKGAVAVGDWVMFVPDRSQYVMAYNPITNTQQIHGTPHNLGILGFRDATAVGDWGVFSPNKSTTVIAYNAITDTQIIANPHGLAINAFREATTIGNWAVFAPVNAENNLAFNPITNTQQIHSTPHGMGSSAYWGASSAGDWAVFAPLDADYVMKYNPITNTQYIHPIAHGMGTSAYRSATTVGDWVVFTPWFAPNVMAFNPLTNTQQIHATPHGLGTRLFVDTVTIGDWAVFAPLDADYVMAYNPITDTQQIHATPHGLGDGAFWGVTKIGDWAVFAPFGSDKVMLYNPITDTMIIETQSKGDGTYWGAASVGDVAVFAPFTSTDIMSYQLTDETRNHSSPAQIQMDKEGNYFITLHETADLLYMIDNEVKKIDLYDQIMGEFVTLSGDAVVYEDDFGLSSYVYYDSGGGFLFQPAALDILSDNETIYIAYTNEEYNFVQKYSIDRSTNPYGLSSLNAFGLSSGVPVDMISDRDGDNLYILVTDYFNQESKINIYDTSDDLLLSSVSVGYGAEFITLDIDQTPWVASRSLSSASKSDVLYTNLSSYPLSTINSNSTIIGGIAGDSYGNVWVIDSDNDRVIIFNKDDPYDYESINITEDQSITTNRYVAYGDWNGFRWYNKFGYGGNTITYELTGQSEPFKILPRNKYRLQKINEDFNATDTLKSYRTTDLMLNYENLFDNFIGGIYGNNLDDGTYIGKNIYEKIANFVMNHGDIETCSIDALESFCEETGIEFESRLDFPRDIKRLVDLFSIKFKKLWGDDYKTGFIEDYRGDELNTLTYNVSADPQVKFIAKEKFNNFYTIIDPLLIDGLSSYPLSSYEQSWGWGLSIPANGDLKDYYEFYEMLPVDDQRWISVIDWENPLTDNTIEPISSFSDYMGENGIVSTILGDKLRDGLGLYL